MNKQIYIILLFALLTNNHLDCANTSKTSKETAQTKKDDKPVKKNLLIKAVENAQIQEVKKLLGKKKFTPQILYEAVKIAKEKGEKGKEIIQLIFAYTPKRKKLKDTIESFLPIEGITSIVEEYTFDTQAIESIKEFYNIIDSTNKKREEDYKKDNREIYKPILFPEKYFFIIRDELSNNDKIILLNILELYLKLHNEKIKQFNNIPNDYDIKKLETKSKDLKESANKIVQEIFNNVNKLQYKKLTELIYSYVFHNLNKSEQAKLKNPKEVEKESQQIKNVFNFRGKSD